MRSDSGDIELDWAALTWLGHALHLVASSFNSLSDREEKKQQKHHGDLPTSWLVCQIKTTHLVRESCLKMMWKVQ